MRKLFSKTGVVCWDVSVAEDLFMASAEVVLLASSRVMIKHEAGCANSYECLWLCGWYKDDTICHAACDMLRFRWKDM